MILPTGLTKHFEFCRTFRPVVAFNIARIVTYIIFNTVQEATPTLHGYGLFPYTFVVPVTVERVCERFAIFMTHWTLRQRIVAVFAGETHGGVVTFPILTF